MKTPVLFCLLFACIGFQSCKKNQNEEVVKAKQILAEKPISVQCYKALYEKDTIDLKMNTLKNGKITGDMVMKFLTHPKKLAKLQENSVEIHYLPAIPSFRAIIKK